MKRINAISVSILRFTIPLMVVALAMNFSSCTKDEANKPAPTVTLSSATASNSAGQKVSTTVTVNAPEGGKTLVILVNGASNTSLPDIALTGQTAFTQNIEFTIPANATVGSNYVISFEALDNKGQSSTSATFTVSVSAIASKQIVNVSGSILTNTTWTADKIYKLQGYVRVGTDAIPAGSPAGTAPSITATATLTIEAGTVIIGEKSSKGTLIIQRGSKIIANGTAAKPIIFTSEVSIGARQPGDWSGLVICGKASNNQTSFTTPNLSELEGGYGAYHGGGSTPDDADNSGTLRYVRVEFAGNPINPNQEVNSFTFGSVGTGTTIEYLQATYGLDDSYEWFGGTANAKYLIAYKGLDDDFDTDHGFRGKVQFGLGIRDKNLADQSGSNGFESDNDGTGTSNTPFTAPVFSNMTIIGGKQTFATSLNLSFQNVGHLRRNTKISIINSFFTGYPTGIFIDNTAGNAIGNATNNELQLKNNVLAGVDAWGGNFFGAAASTDEQAALGLAAAGSNAANNPRGRIVAAGSIASGSNPFVNGVFTVNEAQIAAQNALPWFLTNNVVKSKWSDATLGINANIFEPLNGTPTVLPAAGSILLTGASFSGFTGFDTSVAYKGAFGATDWTATGWVNWNPQITDYSK